MKRRTPILLVILLAGLLMSTELMAKVPAPEGRTYFIVLIGLDDDHYRPEADCLTFDATQACTPGGQTCLEWQTTEASSQGSRESGFSIATQIEENDMVITIEGQGRIDSHGRRSSISAVAKAAAQGAQLNFGFTGRQTGRAKCLRLVEEFEAQMSSP